MVRFDDDLGTRVKIGRQAVLGMLEHAQREPGALEAGGVLLGRELLVTGDLVVDAITTPMPGDVRTSTSFSRSAALHQRRILEAWRGSAGTCGYLGEWHTHPEARPIPSRIDRHDWSRRLVEDVVGARLSLFVIVGTRALGVWIGDRQSRAVRLLGYHQHERSMGP
jgi:integrative and conjugative element protein (TIGR02256 family)